MLLAGNPRNVCPMLWRAWDRCRARGKLYFSAPATSAAARPSKNKGRCRTIPSSIDARSRRMLSSHLRLLDSAHTS
ncbi:hypothetical protein BD311DRAFT_764550 [Dichomitus squalens]|uniref:Uncharacterized protein n=1 Tax=Dichomitus squalens TaxID=114155 RepID=A0A4Q9MDQ9_9APHY|nr:hypothetical protein BD311DRAFT_764550 [Dichomitus squalens]